MTAGRPKQNPTVVIQVPVDKIPDIEAIIGRAVVCNQKPTVNIRVPRSAVAQIRKALKTS